MNIEELKQLIESKKTHVYHMSQSIPELEEKATRLKVTADVYTSYVEKEKNEIESLERILEDYDKFVNYNAAEAARSMIARAQSESEKAELSKENSMLNAKLLEHQEDLDKLGNTFDTEDPDKTIINEMSANLSRIVKGDKKPQSMTLENAGEEVETKEVKEERVGKYINHIEGGSIGTTFSEKRKALVDAGAVQIPVPTQFEKGLVCLVNNGYFAAAAWAFDAVEMHNFITGSGGRIVQWFRYPEAEKWAK